VVFPDPRSSAIRDLPVYDGLGCSLCPFTARLESVMEKHYRKAHPSKRKRGRRSACTPMALAPQYWTSTKCQRFFV
jgi:hypothetical protein